MCLIWYYFFFTLKMFEDLGWEWKSHWSRWKIDRWLSERSNQSLCFKCVETKVFRQIFLIFLCLCKVCQLWLFAVHRKATVYHFLDWFALLCLLDRLHVIQLAGSSTSACSYAQNLIDWIVQLHLIKCLSIK